MKKTVKYQKNGSKTRAIVQDQDVMIDGIAVILDIVEGRAADVRQAVAELHPDAKLTR